MNKPYVTAAILAAGLGTRLSSKETKQKINILGKSVVRRSVEIFDNSSLIDDIIVVMRREEEDFIKKELIGIKKPLQLVYGGSFRAESAKNAFSAFLEFPVFLLFRSFENTDHSTRFIQPDVSRSFPRFYHGNQYKNKTAVTAINTTILFYRYPV